MSELLNAVMRTRTKEKKREAMLLACYIYGGDPAVLKERLEVAETPSQVSEIFTSWCKEARTEPPK